MTSKELLHKFRSKTQSSQNKMTNEQLVEGLRVILDKLKAKMIEQNGVKYLTLPWKSSNLHTELILTKYVN